MTTDHVDVLIVGAGLSGIGAAYHLKANCPRQVLRHPREARDAIGGTWDLFRYPGIRSDSDMFTLGYSFRPWTDAKAIADGPAILDYVRDTASEGGIDRAHPLRSPRRRASRGRRPTRAGPSSAQRTGHRRDGRADRLASFCCTRLLPLRRAATRRTSRAATTSAASSIHPQHWPEDLRLRRQARRRHRQRRHGGDARARDGRDAGHVTMLQRSPTYILALPGEDPIANAIRARPAVKAAYAVDALEERHRCRACSST